MSNEEKYYGFEQYLIADEPDKQERARNWAIAIGLQDVDGLKPSEFLINQAVDNIEGRISSADVGKRLEEYYTQKSVREKAAEDGTLEADLVSERINQLLSEKAFSFSPVELRRIHNFLFKGILQHAGEYRKYNITKNQWVLDGDTVIYGSADTIPGLLAYDFGEEKKFDYSSSSAAEALRHIARFISGVWQIHPFGEGNTRTIAVFLIKYLRSLGLDVNNESFQNHSWYFRNALVRSQYENIPSGIHSTYGPLERFLLFAVYGQEADLRNRTLHIRWAGETPREVAKRHDDVSKTPNAISGDLTLNEVKVLTIIKEDSGISIPGISKKSGLSRRTVDRIIASLKAKNILEREGAKNNSRWKINY